MTKVAIIGAAGRMGLRLVDLIHCDPELQVVSAAETPGHPKIGRDVGVIAGIGEIGVPISDEISTNVDVVVDFSTPAGADKAIEFCLVHKKPLVIATTGLEESTVIRLKESTHQIPIVWAPSMSLAVNLTMKLVEMASSGIAQSRHGCRCGNYRTTSSLQSGCAERHGPQIWRDCRAGHGTNQSTTRSRRHDWGATPNRNWVPCNPSRRQSGTTYHSVWNAGRDNRTQSRRVQSGLLRRRSHCRRQVRCATGCRTIQHA